MFEWLWESFYLLVRIFVILMFLSIIGAFIRAVWERWTHPDDKIDPEDFR